LIKNINFANKIIKNILIKNVNFINERILKKKYIKKYIKEKRVLYRHKKLIQHEKKMVKQNKKIHIHTNKYSLKQQYLYTKYLLFKSITGFFCQFYD
jgi:hypothetical protein